MNFVYKRPGLGSNTVAVSEIETVLSTHVPPFLAGMHLDYISQHPLQFRVVI